ncbi:hypothetical protein [Azohydromonas aeria]|uniref:hypothetical protein n=1 Tax=Azohydromonas aeria TaxID=2590212 RepID=UPI0018DFB35D|nr:hypothetical protein [Azohydromonas aeria]
MFRNPSFIGFALGATLSFAALGAQAELRYRLQELTHFDAIASSGPLGPIDHFIPQALNNRGHVVGYRLQEVQNEVIEYIQTAHVFDGTRLAPLPGSNVFRESVATGINDRGQIVGGYLLPDTAWQIPYLYADGRYRDLRVEATNTWGGASGINASGHISGTAHGKAFFFDGTRSRYMDIPGAVASGAGPLNDQDTVVGRAHFDAPGGIPEERTFVHHENGLRFLPKPLPDFQAPQVTDINNAGQMVANVFNPGEQARRAFLYGADGRFADLGGLSRTAGQTVVEALNDRGWVVGQSESESCDLYTCTEAFLWRDGRMVSLNDLVVGPPGDEWYLSSAVDINERGQIVGNGWRGGANYGAYLLTPVPQPPSGALWLAGLGLVGTLVRRRTAGQG